MNFIRSTSAVGAWAGQPEVTPFRVVSNVMFTCGVLRETFNNARKCHWLDTVRSGPIPESGEVISVYNYTNGPYRITGSSIFSNFTANIPVSYDVHPFVTLDTRILSPSSRQGNCLSMGFTTNIPAPSFVPQDSVLYVPSSSNTVAAILGALDGADSWWKAVTTNETFLFDGAERIVTTNRSFGHWGQRSYDWTGARTHTRPNYYINRLALDSIRTIATNMTTLMIAGDLCSSVQTTYTISTNRLVRDDPSQALALYNDLAVTFPDYWSNSISVVSLSPSDTRRYLDDMVPPYEGLADFAGVTEAWDLIEPPVTYTNIFSSAEITATLRRYDCTFTAVPIEAYESNYVARVRLYVCAETCTPSWRDEGTFFPITNVVDYTPAPINANQFRSMGYGLSFAGMPTESYPTSAAFYYYGGSYIPTNRVWTQVLDVTNPVVRPTFTLAPDPSFVASDDYTLTQHVEGHIDCPGHYKTIHLLYQRMGIRRQIAIVDFNFKHFNSGYAGPVVTNIPAWTTNSLDGIP